MTIGYHLRFPSCLGNNQTMPFATFPDNEPVGLIRRTPPQNPAAAVQAGGLEITPAGVVGRLQAGRACLYVMYIWTSRVAA